MKEHQRAFLRSITHPRFMELRTAVGAVETAGHFDNQLADAYHVWCAEEAGARYFLTTDYKIGKSIAHHYFHTTVDVVTPSELLRDLTRRKDIGWWDRFQARVDLFLRRLRPAPTSGLEDLAALGDRLEEQRYYD
jgi:hypothetical protein